MDALLAACLLSTSLPPQPATGRHD